MKEIDREVLNTAEVAETLNVDQDTLRNWRTQGRGPRFLKMGRSVKYEKTEIESFKEQNRFSSTKQFKEKK